MNENEKLKNSILHLIDSEDSTFLIIAANDAKGALYIMPTIDNYTKTTGTKNNEQVKKRLEIISRNLIPETTLVGYKVTESKVINEKGKYRYFTLLEYPIGEKNQELLNQIKQDEILSTQKDADKAMADLEAEIEKRRKK